MPISNSIDHLFEANPKEETVSVSILDESVLNGDKKAYKLLCTIDASFIGVSVLDTKEAKFLGLETFHFPKRCNAAQLSKKILDLSETSTLLKNVNFNKVSVQLSNSDYTFTPSSLFRKEDAAKYFSFNHSKSSKSKIESENVSGYDMVNVFAVDGQVFSALQKVFNNFSLHNHITSLLAVVRLLPSNDGKKKLFVHFRSAWIDVIVTEGKKLILCNSFNYKSVEDAVYYILLACEQLSLNPSSVETTVMGEVEKESAISKLMQKYMAHVRFSERMNAAKFSYGFDKMPSHFYYSIFSHVLCES